MDDACSACSAGSPRPPRTRRARPAVLAVASALAAGCLVFDGKVALEGPDGAPLDAAAPSEAAVDAADAGRADADATRPPDGTVQPDAPVDGGHDGSLGFCASQVGALACIDFDDASSPDALGATTLHVAVDGALGVNSAPGGPPPPSLPNALDVTLPGSAAGPVASIDMPLFGWPANGVHCRFDVRYDTGAGTQYAPIVTLSLTSNATNGPLFFDLRGGILVVGGFPVAGNTLYDGATNIYEGFNYNYFWANGAWTTVDIKIDVAHGALQLGFGPDAGLTFGVDQPLIPLGQVASARITLGGSEQGNGLLPSVEFHVDNVVCSAL